MVDAIRRILQQIAKSGAEGARDDTPLIARLTTLLLEQPLVPSPPPAVSPQLSSSPDGESATHKIAPRSIGEILISEGAATAGDIASAMQIQREGDPRHLGEILVERGAVKPQDIVEALRIQRVARFAAGDSSVRVDVELLNTLINLVGQLGLTRNQIVQFANTSKDADIVVLSQQLHLITTKLQASVMQTRMQSIGVIWSQFSRTVRDVATDCGKSVHIEMLGKEIELDKSIIEAIKDPLAHLVRNAIDHGIESPDQRVAAGKSSQGLLSLRAYHVGAQVIVEVSDDGAGLDVERIRRKGIEKGLITLPQSLRQGEPELLDLIFQPGFSTAETITKISGRGVGLDVVKSNIAKIGGTVEVESRAGIGTTVRMRVPLTLAILPALIVAHDGDRYAAAHACLPELLRRTEQ
jgi:two-component system, chemotaxis family, sensor kinase CheA